MILLGHAHSRCSVNTTCYCCSYGAPAHVHHHCKLRHYGENLEAGPAALEGGGEGLRAQAWTLN